VMCVRVIMGVVILDWIINNLYCDNVQYQRLLYRQHSEYS